MFSYLTVATVGFTLAFTTFAPGSSRVAAKTSGEWVARYFMSFRVKYVIARAAVNDCSLMLAPDPWPPSVTS